MEIMKGKKVKATTSRKRKNKDKNLVGRQTPEVGEVDLEEQNGKLMVMVWLLLFCEQNIFYLIMLILPFFLNDIRWSSGTL